MSDACREGTTAVQGHTCTYIIVLKQCFGISCCLASAYVQYWPSCSVCMAAEQQPNVLRPGGAASFSTNLAGALVALRCLMSTLHCVCVCKALAIGLDLHGSRTANLHLLCLQHALMFNPVRAYAMCVAGKGHWHDGPGHEDSLNVAADGQSKASLLGKWSADSSPWRYKRRTATTVEQKSIILAALGLVEATCHSK